MPTINELINRVDNAKPNAFSVEQKLTWLTALDGMLAADVFLMDIVEIRQLKYNYPEDLDKTLLVEYPHDEIYDLWLMAKIDFANGEYNKYQNTMEAYNAAYISFCQWFARVYEPAQVGVRRSGAPCYYLTAYGLAVNAGYMGTLEEWLQSLRGDKTELRYQEGVIQWRWRSADDSQEAEGEWLPLIGIDELLGETISADLKAAQAAAQDAEEYARAAEEAKTKAEAAAGEALLQVTIDKNLCATVTAQNIRQVVEDGRVSGAVLLKDGYVYEYSYDLSDEDVALFRRYEIGADSVKIHTVKVDNQKGQFSETTFSYTPSHAEEAGCTSEVNSFLVDLGSEEAATSILDGEQVKPGVTGILPISHGGTGGETEEKAREALGAAAKEHNHEVTELPTIPLTKGGTGATTGAEGLKNLLAAGATVLSSHQYGTSLPAAGTKGRIFFKVVSG